PSSRMNSNASHNSSLRLAARPRRSWYAATGARRGAGCDEWLDPSSGLVGRRGLAATGVLQRDSLENLGLRRVAVDGLGQYLERHLMGHRQRELADHFTGMRCNERRSDDLATAATGIYRRKPLFLAVDKGAFHLGQLEPILIDSDTFFPGLARR